MPPEAYFLAMAVRTAALELFVQGLGQDALDGLEGQHTAHDAELVLKGNLLGADVFAAEEAHAAEYALIVADHIVVLVLGTVVAGIDVETGEAVDGRRAEEVLAHPGRTAGRDAAAAFDAAVELENLLGKLVFHALFFGAGIERLVLRVNPRFDFATHFTEPHATDRSPSSLKTGRGCRTI